MRRLTTLLASSLLVIGSTGRLAEVEAQTVRQDRTPQKGPGRVQDRAVAPAQDVQEEPIDPRMEKLLKLWEGQSRNLKSLDVMIYRRDVDLRPAPFGGEEHYQGTAKFETPNRAYIEFNQIKLDRKKQPMVDPKTKRRMTEPYEQIKCTGKEVWQYKFDTKQIFIFPLSKEEQERALDEGPLPFLFNMKADDARNRYQMSLLPEKPGSKVHQIRVKPRLAVDREDFGEALIDLDKTYLLPMKIVLVAPDKKGTREYYLSHHDANPKKPIDKSFFQGSERVFVNGAEVKDWKVVRNPQGDPGLKGNAASTPRALAPRRN